MSEFTEYDVIDTFWGLLFRFPSLPRRQQTVKFQSLFRLKDQLTKDAAKGRMRKIYQVKNTPQNIMYAAETILEQCINSFCDTDVAEMRINRYKVDEFFMVIEFEVTKWKN